MSEFDLDIRVTASPLSGQVGPESGMYCDTKVISICSCGATCNCTDTCYTNCGTCYTCQTICVCSQPGWTCHGGVAKDGAPLC